MEAPVIDAEKGAATAEETPVADNLSFEGLGDLLNFVSIVVCITKQATLGDKWHFVVKIFGVDVVNSTTSTLKFLSWYES